jgi:hypothetical protein
MSDVWPQSEEGDMFDAFDPFEEGDTYLNILGAGIGDDLDDFRYTCPVCKETHLILFNCSTCKVKMCGSC